MSVRLEAARILAALVIGVGVGIVVAILIALIRGGGFHRSLEIGLIVVGCVAVLLGLMGGSPSRRDATSAGWMARWAGGGTFMVNRENQPETTLSPAFVLCTVGIAMFVLAVGWSAL